MSIPSTELSGLIRFRPPRIALCYLAAAVGLHVLSPGKTILFLPYHMLGISLIAVGLTVMMWAWLLFKKGKTAICIPSDASLLIQDGPYSFTRNPMYLGMTLMLFGTAFLLGSLVAFSAPAAFFLSMNEVFIPFEEARMERLFGDNYVNYKKQVRRWL